MDNLDTLRSLAEVAIALAGFTGIVAILGRRSRGEWSPLEWIRLRMLLGTSLGVLFFTLMPLLIHQLNPSEATLWQVSNGLQALVHIAGGAIFYKQVQNLDRSQWPKEEQLSTKILVPISAIIVIVQILIVFGKLSQYGYFMYLLGIIYFIILAATHFILLLIPEKK